jgi:FixJ family two-component response regulator
MPVLGGHELAVRVGAHFPSLPVLFISGYSDTDLGEEHHANFLQKPFTPHDLTRKVRDVLDA